MRIILFAGKGGVGKTSISLATALLCSSYGLKTLIVSTDTAHNLSDVLNINIGDEVKKVSSNLYCQEIDTQKELQKNWSIVKGHAAPFLERRGIKKIVAEELAIIPGLEEVFNLLEIKRHYDKGIYDVIILDTAPTSSCLRLLYFPEVMGFWVKNIFGILGNKQRPFSYISSFFPKNSNVSKISKTFTTIKNLYIKIKRLKKILQDKDITSVRLILNPERIIIKETQRLWTYLCLFEIGTDAVIINKIIPENISSKYLKVRMHQQQECMKHIQEAFLPLPLFNVYLHPEEISGEKLLLSLGKQIYKDKKPQDVLYKDDYITFQKENNLQVVLLKLPHVKKEKIDVISGKDSVIVSIGDYKQSLVLPDTFKKSKVVSCKFDDKVLKIYFKKE